MFKFISNLFIGWLSKDRSPSKFPLCDFERIRYEVRPGDVLLIEGRSRISEVIKSVTQSAWSHSALYVGRVHDIENPEHREKAQKYFDSSPDTQLIIESMIGKGTIIAPLTEYKNDHIRICRPRGLSPKDSQKVINSVIDKLGTLYDTRHIFDLLRFLLPWSILPRRWRSKLFNAHPNDSTKAVCSTIIAEGFNSVEFPILPYIQKHEEKGIELIQRNPKLYTPRDFDYSPYFEIIKYPFLNVEEHQVYKKLPWNREGLVSHDHEHLTLDNKKINIKKEKISKPPTSQKTNIDSGEKPKV